MGRHDGRIVFFFGIPLLIQSIIVKPLLAYEFGNELQFFLEQFASTDSELPPVYPQYYILWWMEFELSVLTAVTSGRW